VDTVTRLRDVLRQAIKHLAGLDAEAPWASFQPQLEPLGFVPGGETAKRTGETMRLLLGILEAPSPGNLEEFSAVSP
jgi:hypothetical protein